MWSFRFLVNFPSYLLFVSSAIKLNFHFLDEIESQINEEQLSHPIISQEQILFTLHNYRKIDTSTKEGKQKLIDGFVNSIYLYDDRFVITFNYKSQAKTVTFEGIESSPLTSKASLNGKQKFFYWPTSFQSAERSRTEKACRNRQQSRR